MKKGVNPVDLLTEVRMPQMTEGSYSTQHPAVRSSGTWSRDFRPWRMLWLACSAWPLDSGWATDARSSRMWCSSQNSAMAPLAKLVPLSVMMLFGNPQQYMSSRRNLVAVFPSHFRTGLASTHFVNLSTATSRWVKPEGAFLKGPTMSIPHTANDQVMGIVMSAELGTWVWLAYLWHPAHRWTMSTASACAVGQ